MKILLPILFILSITFSFGQKKEIKKAIKLYESGDVQAAEAMLESSAALFEGADVKILNQKTFLEGQIAQSNKDFAMAYEKFMTYKDAVGSNSSLDTQLNTLTSEVVNTAIEDNSEKRFEEAAQKLYIAYQIDKTNNVDYLYYAASSAVNGAKYESALKYYNELKEIKYEGITTQYTAVSVESGEQVELSKSEYDLYQKTKEYTDFKEQTSESKFPEIVKNIALIYSELGDNEKAMGAVKEARAANPKDLNLILTEANLYIQLEENDRFEALMKEAIEQDPTNATLYFNLGVVNAQRGMKESAMGYYKKAIEIDPNYEAGYLNLVSLILEGESSIVEEMNSLGNSRADNARYDVLKTDRENLYKECVPILEKLIEINNNQEAIKTLMNIYGTLGDNEGFMKMKGLIVE
ncbi:tetratricopeptide repeat protein [Flavobacteriaceae bacterium]|nr:tetratricopeptide repeat protein [Flavobacteriaceae bacterium]MDB3862050.1 tetratricopeptide repeat protein [Flavobacteriaceae bacterium]